MDMSTTVVVIACGFFMVLLYIANKQDQYRRKMRRDAQDDAQKSGG